MEQQEKTTVTTDMLHDCYEKVCNLRVEHEKAKEATSAIYQDFNLAKQHMLFLLQEAEFEEFKGKDKNKVSIKRKKTAKMPLDSEGREELFNFLKEKGDFDDLISIHSAKFNSYYNMEREQAIANDPEAEMFFKMPGVDTPQEYVDLTVPTVKKITKGKE